MLLYWLKVYEKDNMFGVELRSLMEVKSFNKLGVVYVDEKEMSILLKSWLGLGESHWWG